MPPKAKKTKGVNDSCFNFTDSLFIHSMLLMTIRSEASRKVSLAIHSSQRIENTNIKVGLLMMNTPKTLSPHIKARTTLNICRAMKKRSLETGCSVGLVATLGQTSDIS